MCSKKIRKSADSQSLYTNLCMPTKSVLFTTFKCWCLKRYVHHLRRSECQHLGLCWRGWRKERGVCQERHQFDWQCVTREHGHLAPPGTAPSGCQHACVQSPVPASGCATAAAQPPAWAASGVPPACVVPPPDLTEPSGIKRNWFNTA